MTTSLPAAVSPHAQVSEKRFVLRSSFWLEEDVAYGGGKDMSHSFFQRLFGQRKHGRDSPRLNFPETLRSLFEPGTASTGVADHQNAKTLESSMGGQRVETVARIKRSDLRVAAPEPEAQASNALDVLNGVEINSVQQAGTLQVFGLKLPGGDGLDYATLDEALLDQMLEITEISERGQVPAIKVENKSGRMVFLMAGELLVGCKQDRVLNTSVMVPSKTEMPIPVACVEVGRWSYKSRKFRSAQTSSHSYLRMILSKETSARYRAKSAPGSGQGAIWGEVARKMSRMGSGSSSSALQDMFEDYNNRLNQALQDLSAPAGCRGAAFATNGKLLGLDLFDKQATFVKLWPKLVKSYAIDAVENRSDDQKSLQPDSVLKWTKSARSAKREWFDSPGLGQDVRIEDDMLTGGALVVEQRLIHLQLFRKNEIGSGS